MTKLKLLLLALPFVATPALADLACNFDLVCLPDEPCKASEFTMEVLGTKAAPMFKMAVFDAYPAQMVEKTGYEMFHASTGENAGWEILTFAPDGQAQFLVANAPDMALPFSFRGACSGELK